MINKPICFVAGKSGGHIIPCLTLLQQKSERHEQMKALFFSANTPLDYQIVSQNELITKHVPLPLTAGRTNSFYNFFITLCHFLYSFLVSFFYLVAYQPSQIITTGGAVAVPVCYAGYCLGIPIILYCLDVVPGKAALAIAPLTTSLYACFNKTRAYFKNAQFKNYPVRYTKQGNSLTREQKLNKLGLDSTKKTIVVLGGSQGSSFLNELTKQLIAHLLFAQNAVQLIHQTGAHESNSYKMFYDKHGITNVVFDYKNDLSDVYDVADLIICRAGAGTLFEALFFKKPCIIIPLITPTTQHQRDNAQTTASEYPELCSWLEQADIEKNPEILYQKICFILKD